MAIPEYHFYHGAALSLIVSQGQFTGLARMPELGKAAYAVNHDTGIYIKHATTSSSPWQFIFKPDHQEAIRGLYKKYSDKTFIALVCEKEGVCLLTYGQYASVINENFKTDEGVSVERPGGGGFRVQGRAGKLNYVIRLNQFPADIFRQ